MPARVSSLLFLAAAALLLVPSRPVTAHDPRPAVPAADAAAGQVGAAWAGAFAANTGQWPARVRFAGHVGGLGVRVAASGFDLDLRGGGRAAMLQFAFLGGAREPATVGEGLLPARAGFFVGADPGRWRADVPRYRGVRFVAPYDGVDVVLTERAGRLEYDLELAPGADLAAVGLRIDGALALHVADDGSLVAETGAGPLVQPAPTCWQQGARGERQRLAGSYRLLGPARFGFRVDAWDGETPLVIDPGLVYATYLGGPSYDQVEAVVRGADGMLTMALQCNDGSFPTTPGAYDPNLGGSPNILLVRLDPSRTGAAQLLWATYFGSIFTDHALALAVDPDGTVVVGGYSGDSAGFPTTPNAWLRAANGGFLARFDPAATGLAQLAYCTRTGDGGSVYGLQSHGNGVITYVGASGQAMVTTAGCFDPTHGAGGDGYLARIDTAQPVAALQLLYATYLGGNNDESARAVVVRSANDVYVAGHTRSTDFPTSPTAYARSRRGVEDFFAVRLDLAATGPAQLLWGSYLGGSQYQRFGSLAVGPTGTVLLAGSTDSPDFPTTPDAYDRTFVNSEAVLSLLDPAASGTAQLVWSSFLGGGNSENTAFGDLDAAGVLTAVGTTSSANFPTTPGAFATSLQGYQDVFVARLAPWLPPARQLLYGSFYGGSGSEDLFAAAFGVHGLVTLGGSTDSTNQPLSPNAYDPTYGSTVDAFVAVLEPWPRGAAAFGTSTPGCLGALPVAVTGMPALGNPSFAFLAGGALPWAPSLAIYSGGALAAPVSLQGAALWVDPMSWWFGALFQFADGQGRCALPLAIPADPGFAGLPLHVQFASLDGCAPGGVAASYAVGIVMQ